MLEKHSSTYLITLSSNSVCHPYHRTTPGFMVYFSYCCVWNAQTKHMRDRGFFYLLLFFFILHHHFALPGQRTQGHRSLQLILPTLRKLKDERLKKCWIAVFIYTLLDPNKGTAPTCYWLWLPTSSKENEIITSRHAGKPNKHNFSEICQSLLSKMILEVAMNINEHYSMWSWPVPHFQKQQTLARRKIKCLFETDIPNLRSLRVKWPIAEDHRSVILHMR